MTLATVDTPMEWESLPPPVPEPQDQTPDETGSEAPICPECNEPIIRQPDWKRMRKLHPECAAKRNQAGKHTTSGTGGRSTRAEREADEIAESLKSALVKAALAVSVVDRFDAFCIMANAQTVCDNFRMILLRYPAFRKECLNTRAGGGVIGLAIALAMIVVPILAHHGMIPSRRVSEFLVTLPIQLFRLSQKLQEGEEGLRTMMQEEYDRIKAESQARRTKAQANGRGDFVGATTHG